MDEIKDKTSRGINIIVMSAFSAVSCVAILAIALCLYLIRDNDRLESEGACRTKIANYVADIRDDVNIQGWDAMVARAEGTTQVEVKVIAAEMRNNITKLKGPARELKNQAFQICSDNPNFEPR